MAFQTRECSCGRGFLLHLRPDGTPERCSEHCTARCCRLNKCPEFSKRPRDYRKDPSDRKCVVCFRKREHFEAFSECDEGCYRFFYHTSKVDAGFGTVARRWICHTHHPEDDRKRIHLKYCSFRCWSSINWGAVEQQSMSRRAARKRAALNNSFGGLMSLARKRQLAAEEPEGGFDPVRVLRSLGKEAPPPI